MITVGQIVKPQGVRGEVKVKPMTNDPSRFCVLKTVFIGAQPYKLTSVRVSGDFVYAGLSGVADRNGAEALRGKFLTIDRAAAVALDEGEFFIADLVGATLATRLDGTNTRVGVIASVQSFGAADVFEVKLDSGKSMSFAFVKALNAEYDEAAHTLTVDEARLNEVAVYDED